MSLSFLAGFARDPIAVGAIWPSGRALARHMVEQARLSPGQLVVELGAGTGPITAVLSSHQGPLLALEPDPALAERCRQRCPGIEVVEALAQDLPGLLADRGHSAADRIISGLPFASWSEERQRSVLDAVATCLVDAGIFVTFTYAHSPWLPAGRRFRRTLGHRFDHVEISPVIWPNLPPALTYTARGLRCRTPG